MNDEEALDNYLLWELCKRQGIQRDIIEFSADGKELKEDIVEKVRKDYRGNNYSLDEKIKKMWELDNNPKYRRKIFRNRSWEKETVEIEDLGTTLPRLGDLPPEVISGSLPEVVEWVKKANPEKYQSVVYILRLKEVPEVLNEFYPWIIHSGNRESKRERLNDVHGDKDWEIEETCGMINDGNHRTIARILTNGLEEIECYVGRSVSQEKEKKI